MAQPHKGDRERIGTRVPIATAERVRAAAAAECCSLSDLLLTALERYVEQHERVRAGGHDRVTASDG